MVIDWHGILSAAAQALLIMVALTVIYRILFRLEAKWAWARSIVARTRLWAYAGIFMASLWWFVFQGPSMAGREQVLKLLSTLGPVILIVLSVETLTALVYDYYLILKRQASVPTLFRDFARGILYLGLFGFLLWRFLGIDLLPLLTTSAIVSIILGLALQDTIGNVFAGLALHLSHPFSLGDWINVGPHEGRVEKIDWRATSIRTLSGDYVIIPNSSMARLELHNYSSPTIHHARIVTVGAHYRHPPHLVIDTLLRAAGAVGGVLSDPPPVAGVIGYGDSAVNYRLKFWIDDFSVHVDIESEVLKQIWYHFRRAGVTIPFPIRDVYHHRGEDGGDASGDEAAIGAIDFFKPLSSMELASLVERLRHDYYPRGDVLFRQGDPASRFYLVKSGAVEVTVEGGAGEALYTARLAEGAFFGEMSLLTGQARSATVRILEDAELLSLGREDFKGLMAGNPKLAELICDALAERQTRTTGRLADRESPACAEGGAGQDDPLQWRDSLLRRIRDFFSY